MYHLSHKLFFVFIVWFMDTGEGPVGWRADSGSCLIQLFFLFYFYRSMGSAIPTVRLSTFIDDARRPLPSVGSFLLLPHDGRFLLGWRIFSFFRRFSTNWFNGRKMEPSGAKFRSAGTTPSRVDEHGAWCVPLGLPRFCSLSVRKIGFYISVGGGAAFLLRVYR